MMAGSVLTQKMHTFLFFFFFFNNNITHDIYEKPLGFSESLSNSTFFMFLCRVGKIIVCFSM